MAIQIKLIDRIDLPPTILETIHVETTDVSTWRAQTEEYQTIRAAMAKHAKVQLTQPEFKVDGSLFGGYWRDKFGNCVIAE